MTADAALDGGTSRASTAPKLSGCAFSGIHCCKGAPVLSEDVKCLLSFLALMVFFSATFILFIYIDH